MPLFDLPLEQLYIYRPTRTEPADFDAFWAQTLAEVRQYPLNPIFEQVDYGLKAFDTYDVTFSGYGGQRIKGWFIQPAGNQAKLPGVVEFIGYGGGRGYPINWLTYPAAGYAYLVMDTRGQGSAWQRGDTPDLPDGDNPHTPGSMTQGILNPKNYFYRRLFSDAVRAVETMLAHPMVDPARVAVTGGSQGGGISIAASGLVPEVSVCIPHVPFLCHFRRSTEIASAGPYLEIISYLATHRDKIDKAFETLAYFDGVNFAARTHAKCLYSTGLVDTICPPSTVFAAYNQVPTEKEIRVYPYNNHEGGGADQILEALKYLRAAWN